MKPYTITSGRRFPFGATQFPTGKMSGGDLPDITWHGSMLNEPRWDDPGSRVLAYTLAGAAGIEAHLHIMINMSGEIAQMQLPAIQGCSWHRAVDTSQPSPADIMEPADRPEIAVNGHSMAARSVAVLEGRGGSHD